MYKHPRQEQASAPDVCRHGPLDRQAPAPELWSPSFVGLGSQEDSHMPLLWASCPLVRALVLGLSGPLRAMVLCPEAIPSALLCQ